MLLIRLTKTRSKRWLKTCQHFTSGSKGCLDGARLTFDVMFLRHSLQDDFDFFFFLKLINSISTWFKHVTTTKQSLILKRVLPLLLPSGYSFWNWVVDWAIAVIQQIHHPTMPHISYRTITSYENNDFDLNHISIILSYVSCMCHKEYIINCITSTIAITHFISHSNTSILIIQVRIHFSFIVILSILLFKSALTHNNSRIISCNKSETRKKRTFLIIQRMW